jgi:beta-lactamase regulating signal transducer with metallopeptidase domain
MLALQHDLIDAMNTPSAQFLLDAAVKATVLLAAALVAASLLRRSSAAVRHRISCLTFAALVLLPGLSAALPEWRLAVLPYSRPFAYSSPLAPREESTLTTAPAQPTEYDVARFDSPPLPAIENVPARHPVPLAEQAGYVAPLRGEPDEPHRLSIDLAMLWLIGVFIALLPLIVGFIRTLIVRRRSRTIDDANWTSLIDELCRRLSLARRVSLYETATALMPMTWGVLRPVVMLPRQARDWTDRLRRIVLLHELAHVKRCDVAFQLLGRVACALYWFHPLAWYALRRLRIERELACDDCVVLAGERATDYATELVEIARFYRSLPFAAAIAMAQRNSLEHRLRAMFDRACSHLPVTPRAARLLLVAVLLIVTTVAAVRLAPRASAEDESPQAGSKTKGTAAPDAKPFHIKVRVVDHDGSAIAGARVRVLRVDSAETAWNESGHVVAEGLTDREGTVSLYYDDAGPFAAGEQFVSPGIVVIVDAEGYAFDWYRPASADDETLVRLPRDDAPIEGRVLDLEGRPRAGVHVGIVAVERGTDGIDAWVASATKNPPAVDPDSAARPIRSRELQKPAEVARFPSHDNVNFGDRALFGAGGTDEKGHFRLEGLGRDRLVMLELSQGGIAKTWLKVVTREIPGVPYPEYDPRFRVQTCFGRSFSLTAEPEQPIEGLVRDAENGQPLAGVDVRLAQYADELLTIEGFLSAVTDQRGHYSLRGVPKPHDVEGRHNLSVVPPPGLPYFRAGIRVGREAGLGPVTCDMQLKRARWLHGRVTDAATGKPILGMVEYYPFLSNSSAKDYPNFDPGTRSIEGDRYPTDAEGTYRLPVLPGRGVVAFIAKDRNRYPVADGADAIAGLRREGDSRLNVYHLEGAEIVTAVRDVNLSSDALEDVCDIQLRPLDVVQVKLVDSAGQAVVGAVTRRLTPSRFGPNYNWWSYDPLPSATAEIVGPRDKSRTVMFLHRERKLAAVLSLPAAEDLPKQLVLRPCASIAGRIVDREEKPIARLNFELNAVPRPPADGASGRARVPRELDHQLQRLATGDDGRFRVDLVPPGVAYIVWARFEGQQLSRTTPVIDPGQSLDLGDLVLESPEGTAPRAGEALPAKHDSGPPRSSIPIQDADQPGDLTVTDEQSQIVILRGRVLLPDGKPAAGANLYWAQIESSRPRSMRKLTDRGATDQQGRFEITLTPADLPATPSPLSLVAHKAGFGIAWEQVDRNGIPPELTLRLVEDRPIRGRLTDTEGRPVAGARVTVNNVLASADGSLNAFLLAWRHDWRFAWTKLDRPGALYAPLGRLMGASTDGDGRFTISGVGVERVAEVDITAPGYACDELHIVNREGFDARPYNDLALSGLARMPPMRFRGMTPHLTGPQVTHILGAELVIRGKVSSGPDRAPVVGAIVNLDSFGYAPIVSAITDAAGHYELRGQPRELSVMVSAGGPEGSGFLDRSVQREAAPTEKSLEIEVELNRGIVVTGRVFDRATGEGVKAYLRCVPLPGNTCDPTNHNDPTSMSDDSGAFRMFVMPGPGVLMAQVDGGPSIGGQQINPYRQASFSRKDSQRVPTTVDGDTRFFTGRDNTCEFLMTENAVKLIDVATDSGPVTCDLPVDPGKAGKIEIEDERGQPVTGAFVAGYADTEPSSLRLSQAACTIYGLGADRPRRVCIFHPERRLAGTVTLRGDEQWPVKVRLTASASIFGRALHPDGQPLADALVQINYDRRSASALDDSLDLERPPQKTDADGRFHVDNIIPAERFALDFKQGDTFFRAPVIPLLWDKRSLNAGQKLDLGNVNVK